MPSDNSNPRVPRITDRAEVTTEFQHHFDQIAKTRGKVHGPFSVLMNSPELAGRVGHLGAYIRYESIIDSHDRELAIITTARELDSAFEWAVHKDIATEEGVLEDTINTVLHETPLDTIPERDENIIRFTREGLRDHEVSDETFDATTGMMGPKAVVELSATIGYYSMLAVVMNVLEVHADNDIPFG